jgi:hypothetical protein
MSPLRRFRVIVPAVLLVPPLILASATAALAQVTEPGPGDDTIFVLNGGVQIARDQQVRDVVVINGPVTIEGVVRGDVFVLNGATTIGGEVTGDVIVVNGAVAILAGARIGGDLVTGSGARSISPDATVSGEIRSINFDFVFGRAAIVGAILVWLAVALSALALGMLFLLLAPRAAEAVASVAQTKVGPVIGWGFAAFFGIPVGAGIAIATIVGIPLGIGVLLSLGLLYPFAGIMSAYALGRALLRPPTSRFVSFLLGWVILAGATLIPFLGGLAWFAAMVYGLGSIVVSVWNARREPIAFAAPGAAAPLPPPPTP